MSALPLLFPVTAPLSVVPSSPSSVPEPLPPPHPDEPLPEYSPRDAALWTQTQLRVARSQSLLQPEITQDHQQQHQIQQTPMFAALGTALRDRRRRRSPSNPSPVAIDPETREIALVSVTLTGATASATRRPAVRFFAMHDDNHDISSITAAPSLSSSSNDAPIEFLIVAVSDSDSVASTAVTSVARRRDARARSLSPLRSLLSSSANNSNNNTSSSPMLRIAIVPRRADHIVTNPTVILAASDDDIDPQTQQQQQQLPLTLQSAEALARAMPPTQPTDTPTTLITRFLVLLHSDQWSQIRRAAQPFARLDGLSLVISSCRDESSTLTTTPKTTSMEMHVVRLDGIFNTGIAIYTLEKGDTVATRHELKMNWRRFPPRPAHFALTCDPSEIPTSDDPKTLASVTDISTFSSHHVVAALADAARTSNVGADTGDTTLTGLKSLYAFVAEKYDDVRMRAYNSSSSDHSKDIMKERDAVTNDHKNIADVVHKCRAFISSLRNQDSNTNSNGSSMTTPGHDAADRTLSMSLLFI